MEFTALALLAADRDRSAHGVHDTLGDGHAQPGPLCLSDPVVVFPAEGLEYRLLILLRHTDACVAHQEMGADQGGVLRQRLLIHGQLNGALLRGEFDGVPQQIDQHLIQPHTVATHILRQDLPGSRLKLLVFRRDLGLHDIDDAVHRLPQRHRLHIQRHFAAFDLGYIQYVVDKPQQVLAGQRDLTQVIPNALWIVRIVQCQGGHPDDGVHGRADIVAHAGQEFLFRRVGLFRLLPRLLRGFSRRVHLRVDARQLRHLVPEQLQVPEEYVEEHRNHRKGGGVDDNEPPASHA